MKVTVHDNWHEGVKSLPVEEQGRFYVGVMRYAFEGVEPEFEGILKAVWGVVRPFVDKSLKAQEYGAMGGDGRGNKKGSKTTSKTHLENPSENPTENQKEEKGIEGNGNETSKGSLPIPLGEGAGGDEPAPFAKDGVPCPPEVGERVRDVLRVVRYA